uniref:Uncharacterized protein n=1 Tax=Chromera velia CCMP2878 TaxID=1169474 RepID=A0A0G4H767_9ALVE|eukprot:Cvel_24996.t1-p1 / transcript=Cvel_24996.t1 / gene=Cvel_24996 / organism=Chromera_velia_CCMP2878 / gene_product=hypothetical protein / transcript_product=hypothetical protein / location=Cvel_scaffold2770:21653-22641(+) / protein_length=219 / sequence_SO=supercontig / SO=protein_coding / is_pseudo=false
MNIVLSSSVESEEKKEKERNNEKKRNTVSECASGGDPHGCHLSCDHLPVVVSSVSRMHSSAASFSLCGTTKSGHLSVSSGREVVSVLLEVAETVHLQSPMCKIAQGVSWSDCMRQRKRERGEEKKEQTKREGRNVPSGRLRLSTGTSGLFPLLSIVEEGEAENCLRTLRGGRDGAETLTFFATLPVKALRESSVMPTFPPSSSGMIRGGGWMRVRCNQA